MDLRRGTLLGVSAIAIGSVLAPSARAQPVPTVPAWAGVYVGVFGGGLNGIGGGGLPEVGGQFGFNFVRGSFVGGAEVEFALLLSTTGSALLPFRLARAGFLAGQSILIFATLGTTVAVLPAPEFYWTAGGGIEIGMTNHLSAAFEVRAQSLAIGAPAVDAITYTFGLNWHP